MHTLMNTIGGKVLLPLALVASIVLLAGCDRAGQQMAPGPEDAAAGDITGPDKPLGEVMEFDGYTMRANITRADVLSDTMARQYGIAANPDLALLNLVIQDDSEARQDATVEATVSVQYENLLGQTQVVDIRAVEADGYISYVGTLDASSQRVFQLSIKAQPDGTEQMLEMHFAAQLDW
ncbi:protein of unknown function [Arsukibacterium tuosuense]|uniref:DUF4426 domain-containing protein n=1 Tax=Arsukibacterium tuosuense TaxID=1323745 RepID=A0A285IF48_9GAMM|nr:DUF4426 domain-containing protein [Arsukibacterium tuosuense]SNY45571.1 protein of unknown function [Arsukibacterium tuosuense]